MATAANRIKDIGPQPQSFDIERATKENPITVQSRGAGDICK